MEIEILHSTSSTYRNLIWNVLRVGFTEGAREPRRLDSSTERVNQVVGIMMRE
jgi:hypothetical protein